MFNFFSCMVLGVGLQLENPQEPDTCETTQGQDRTWDPAAVKTCVESYSILYINLI